MKTAERRIWNRDNGAIELEDAVVADGSGANEALGEQAVRTVG